MNWKIGISNIIMPIPYIALQKTNNKGKINKNMPIVQISSFAIYKFREKKRCVFIYYQTKRRPGNMKACRIGFVYIAADCWLICRPSQFIFHAATKQRICSVYSCCFFVWNCLPKQLFLGIRNVNRRVLFWHKRF